MPRLTLYLLKIATDTKALDDFRKHRDGLRTHLMTPECGLTLEQAEAVASLDSRRIQEAVNKELEAESAFDKGSKLDGIHFNFEVNHIQVGGAPKT